MVSLVFVSCELVIQVLQLISCSQNMTSAFVKNAFYFRVLASANGHCTASQHSDTPKHWAAMLRTNQKFHHKFSAFGCMKIAKNYAQVFSPLSHTIKFSIMLFFFAGRHFFIRKMKIKMADRHKHVLSKVVKN